MFSLFISEVADFVRENGKHGIQLIPGFEEIFLLLFADDIALISSTPSGLQNQIDNLEKASKSLGLTVKLRRMPTERFPKQALIMMQNDIDNNGSRNTRSWASDIKHCL